MSMFLGKPVDVVEGISLRASCFDGGICNVRVGCDWFSSKSVSISFAYNTCVGFDFVEMNGRWWLVDCFCNGSEDISLESGANYIA